MLLLFSRPKQVKDVAHQDEVVRVLTNTLETTNVTYYSSLPLLSLLNLSFFLKPHFLINLVPIFPQICVIYLFTYFPIMYLHVVPSHALLWTARHRQDHHRTRHCPPALRVVIHFHPLLLIQF